MKILSIREPGCWLILRCLDRDPRRFENRTWSTDFRGDFLVHSAPDYDQAAADWVEKNFGIVCPAADALPLGGIVGVVRLVAVHTESQSRWFRGPYGFQLANPYPLPFLPCPAKPGFFEP